MAGGRREIGGGGGGRRRRGKRRKKKTDVIMTLQTTRRFRGRWVDYNFDTPKPGFWVRSYVIIAQQDALPVLKNTLACIKERAMPSFKYFSHDMFCSQYVVLSTPI